MRERLKVQKADALPAEREVQPGAGDRGRELDPALYRANGFDEAKVTPDVKDVKTEPRWQAVEDGRDPGEIHDGGGAAAEVRHGEAGGSRQQAGRRM